MEAVVGIACDGTMGDVTLAQVADLVELAGRVGGKAAADAFMGYRPPEPITAPRGVLSFAERQKLLRRKGGEGLVVPMVTDRLYDGMNQYLRDLADEMELRD